MAKYTLELRELFTPIKFNPTLYNREDIEGWFKDYQLTDYLNDEQISTINKMGVWSQDKLAKKIVDHYYMREIGFETPMLFQHYAKVTMQEIMEKYLPLIYSASIKYDPLVNVDFTESFQRNAEKETNIDNTGTTSGSTESSSSSSGLGVNSDTPQGQITKATILEGKYASSTNANENEISDNTSTTTETNSNSQGTDNTNETYTKRVKGNSGVSATAQKMVQQYRQNIIAIDNQIIHDEEIQKLFMGLY